MTVAAALGLHRLALGATLVAMLLALPQTPLTGISVSGLLKAAVCGAMKEATLSKITADGPEPTQLKPVGAAGRLSCITVQLLVPKPKPLDLTSRVFVIGAVPLPLVNVVVAAGEANP